MFQVAMRVVHVSAAKGESMCSTILDDNNTVGEPDDEY